MLQWFLPPLLVLAFCNGKTGRGSAASGRIRGGGRTAGGRQRVFLKRQRERDRQQKQKESRAEARGESAQSGDTED